MAETEHTLKVKIDLEDFDAEALVIDKIANAVLASPRFAARVSEIVQKEAARNKLFIVKR